NGRDALPRNPLQLAQWKHPAQRLKSSTHSGASGVARPENLPRAPETEFARQTREKTRTVGTRSHATRYSLPNGNIPRNALNRAHIPARLAWHVQETYHVPRKRSLPAKHAKKRER